jgi:hypothetical protein
MQEHVRMPHRKMRGKIMDRWSARVFVAVAASAVLMSAIAGPAAQAQLRLLQQQQQQQQQQQLQQLQPQQSTSGTPSNEFSATFSGFEEIGSLTAPTGAILSNGQGQLTLIVDPGKQFVNFQLTYSGLSSNVTQSHIHFGKEHVAGGIMVFFCTNGTPPSPPTPKPPACPSTGGMVSGTITSANMLAIAGQNVPGGDLTPLLAALQSNTAYGNIHTTMFPSGEIRGQIQSP